MKFAVIGDIHGNKYALESVLKNLESKDIDFILSTGDLVGYLPFPNEVIALIREKKILSVQGNHDKAIADSTTISKAELEKYSEDLIQKSASKLFTSSEITEGNKNFLENLPQKISFECGGKKILVVHGSPESAEEYLYEEGERLLQVAVKMEEDILICGHTHIPYFKKINEKYFLNAGSVGKPKHGNQNSTYILVEVSQEKVSCHMEEVEYEVEKMVKDIKRNSMISDSLIELLLQGK